MATKKTAAKKSPAKKTAKKTAKKAVHKWSAKVETDSTHPDEGLFKESAESIAKALHGRKVSPKGPGSGMQMLNFYINRAGKNLPEERIKTLEHAKELLSAMIAKDKPAKKTAKKAAKQSAKKTSAK